MPAHRLERGQGCATRWQLTGVVVQERTAKQAQAAQREQLQRKQAQLEAENSRLQSRVATLEAQLSRVSAALRYCCAVCVRAGVCVCSCDVLTAWNGLVLCCVAQCGDYRDPQRTTGWRCGAGTPSESNCTQ